MIELQGVTKVFLDGGAEVVAVEDVDLRVETGQTQALIGTSGCGKTTTLKMINRLVEPTRGRILLGGEDVTGLDVISLRRRIGYVIQDGGLFPHMTVARNIGLLCRLEGWNAERTDARVRELMALVNLPHDEFAHRYPGELSGGQQQRVGVARGLALDPDYVLMDEPFGALDPITRGHVQDEFQQLEHRVQKTIVLVTHDLDEAFKLADRVTIMHRGKLVQTGTEEELRSHPANAFVERFLTGNVAVEADA